MKVRDISFIFVLICIGSVSAADTSQSISQVRLKRQTLDKLEEYDHSVARERQAESPDVDTMALWYPEKVAKKDKAETAAKKEAEVIYDRFKAGEKLSTEDLMSLQKAGYL